MPVVLLSLIIVAAQIVETVTGFGATVIALALGVHIVPIETLVVALVLIGLLQSLWLVARGFGTSSGACSSRASSPHAPSASPRADSFSAPSAERV